MKKSLVAVVMGLGMLVPSLTYAHQLSPVQVNAVISLLQAFNVDDATIDEVYAQLMPNVVFSDKD